MKRSCSTSAVGLLSSLLFTSGATAANFDDALVQPPELPPPERGSVGGSLASFTIETSAIARGSVSIPLDLVTPNARGDLLAEVFPMYRFEEGLSEWGMGFAASLSIQRFRPQGDIDYTNDEFTSPWGRLRLGTDGHYYVRGLKRRMRIERRASSWLARSPDGTEYFFDLPTQTSGGTYAWYLTRVRTVLGDESQLTFTRNPYGRPFLSQVTYGARGRVDTYRIEISYDLLPFPIEDYRPRAPHHLDRRVRLVEMQARSSGTGGYATRWRYHLTYDEDPTGPAYYLASVRREFPSGASEPSQRFFYDFPSAHLQAARHDRIDALLPFVATVGTTALQPDFSASIDLDLDGRMDLEYRFDQRRFRQTASGWVEEHLPPNPQADPRCRGSLGFQNPVRQLHRPNPDRDAIRVIAFSDLGSSTGVVLCDELGNLIDSTVLSGRWSPSAATRFVDLNRDGRPDLLRVFSGGYGIRFSQGSENGLAFSPEVLAPLQLGYGLDAVWAHDLNGDHLVDLFARVGSTYHVYIGLGGGIFSPTAQPVVLQDLQGRPVTGVASHMNITFVDANRDGLKDFLLTDDFTAVLLSNRGHQQGGHVFRLVDVPALFAVPGARRSPIVGDFRGVGETEVLFTNNTGEVYSVPLTSAGSGLLLATSDGKGNTLVLGKRRAPAFAGGRDLPTVLDWYELDHGSGLDSDAAQFFYRGPIRHSLDHHLMGFEEVGQYRQKGAQVARFNHDDDDSVLTSLVTYSEATTAYAITSGAWAGHVQPAPGATERYLEHTYDVRSYEGVSYRRLRSTIEGLRHSGGDARKETFYRQYDRELCPSEVETRTLHGTLTRRTHHARVSMLPGDRHCLPERLEAIGLHPDPRHDFHEVQRIERNAHGQVTRVVREGNAGDVLLQEVTYDGLLRPRTFSRSSGDWLRVDYDVGTGLLAGLTSASGVAFRVGYRDPLMDGIRRREVLRGGATPYVEEFSFDPLERLVARWRPAFGTSATNPEIDFSYGFPSETTPGFIQARAHPTPGTSAEVVDLFGGHGREIAQLLRVPQGYSVRSSRAFTPELGQARSFSSNGLPPNPGPGALTYGHLDSARLLEVALEERSSLGFPELRAWKNPGVTGKAETRLRVVADRAILETTISGIRTLEEQDAEGLVLASEDGQGYRTEHAYDAMGRLLEVRLPSGIQHSIDFDDYGRVASLQRDGVGSVSYTYDNATNQLSRRAYRSTTGRLERVIHLTYDAIGRLVEEAHEHISSGRLLQHELVYDGAGTGRSDQLGFLTRVRGPDHEITTVYNSDETVAEQVAILGHTWKVLDSFSYFATGDPRTRRRQIVELASGRVLEDTLQEDVLDGHGRLLSRRVNGATAFSLAYDASGNGLLRAVTFPSGGQRDFYYDDGRTLQRMGAAVSHGGQYSGAFFFFDDRGHIARENVSAMGSVWERIYTYSSRSFLVGAQDSTGSSRGAWAYDADGLPSFAEDGTGPRAIHRSGMNIQAGGVHYRLDDLGRVMQRGADLFEHGPSGRIETAFVNGASLEYSYDRHGNRILKRRNGSVVAAYLGDTSISAAGAIEPIRVEGEIIGVLNRGRFDVAHVDSRGSLVLDEHARPTEPNAYGTRVTTRTPLMEALDFAGKGYDPDLKTIRMGVRDYDPHLGQFWSPDPLFLEEVDRCASSPVECNLFSYARNNPLRYVDPTGESAKDALAGIAIGFFNGVAIMVAATFGTNGHDETGESTREAIRSVEFVPEPGVWASGPDDLDFRAGVEFGKILGSGTLVMAGGSRTPAPKAPTLRPASQQPRGGAGRVLRDGEGATAAEMEASAGGPTGGTRAGQSAIRQELLDEAAATSGGVYQCWRCGQTTRNPDNMHVGHRNVSTSQNGNLSRSNVCLEGAACNLSAGSRGAPSPGMSCAERGSCGAPYGRTD